MTSENPADDGHDQVSGPTKSGQVDTSADGQAKLTPAQATVLRAAADGRLSYLADMGWFQKGDGQQQCPDCGPAPHRGGYGLCECECHDTDKHDGHRLRHIRLVTLRGPQPWPVLVGPEERIVNANHEGQMVWVYIEGPADE